MSKIQAAHFTRLFSSTVGMSVLQYLKDLTHNRVLPASCSDAELRFLEGQRYLVSQIENLIKQGKQNPSI